MLTLLFVKIREWCPSNTICIGGQVLSQILTCNVQVVRDALSRDKMFLHSYLLGTDHAGIQRMAMFYFLWNQETNRLILLQLFPGANWVDAILSLMVFLRCFLFWVDSTWLCRLPHTGRIWRNVAAHWSQNLQSLSASNCRVQCGCQLSRWGYVIHQ